MRRGYCKGRFMHRDRRENRRQRIPKLHLRSGVIYKTLHRIQLFEHSHTYISELPQSKMKSYQLTSSEMFQRRGSSSGAIKYKYYVTVYRLFVMLPKGSNMSDLFRSFPHRAFL
jgi:hypothetical protein